jgi:hypothetical protein
METLEALKEQEVDYSKLHYSIRYGREAKMYTLWRVVSFLNAL